MANWDERYRKGEHIAEEPNPLIVKFASTLSPGRALDIACGAGRHAIWLAEHGWRVTAVDGSIVAIDLLRERARQRGVAVESRVADLERHEFKIEPAGYGLIIVSNYLQRDLFPAIRSGTSPGGVVIAVIAMVDGDSNLKPMNPAYLVQPGELRQEFKSWILLHDFEGKPHGDSSRRANAEVVARCPAARVPE